MLPTTNFSGCRGGVDCCDCCDCCHKVTRPFTEHERRNRKIDRIIERDPERAENMTRYGWSGVIAAVLCMAFQALFYYLTNFFIETASNTNTDTFKDVAEGFFVVITTAPLAIVTFVCGLILGVSGCWSAISLGRNQKRLNDRAIGNASIIFGVLCLIFMIAGIVILVVSFK